MLGALEEENEAFMSMVDHFLPQIRLTKAPSNHDDILLWFQNPECAKKALNWHILAILLVGIKIELWRAAAVQQQGVLYMQQCFLWFLLVRERRQHSTTSGIGRRRRRRRHSVHDLNLVWLESIELTWNHRLLSSRALKISTCQLWTSCSVVVTGSNLATSSELLLWN